MSTIHTMTIASVDFSSEFTYLHGHLHHHHYFKQFLRLFHYIYIKLPIVTFNYSCIMLVNAL